MDWMQILLIVGANLGTTISLFLWSRHEAGEDRKEHAADRRETQQLIRDIQNEMKNFHGRLEKQDAEFKAHMIYEHGKKG